MKKWLTDSRQNDPQHNNKKCDNNQHFIVIVLSLIVLSVAYFNWQAECLDAKCHDVWKKITIKISKLQKHSFKIILIVNPLVTHWHSKYIFWNYFYFVKMMKSWETILNAIAITFSTILCGKNNFRMSIKIQASYSLPPPPIFSTLASGEGLTRTLNPGKLKRVYYHCAGAASYLLRMPYDWEF